MKSKPKETTQPKTPEQIMDKLQDDLSHWKKELRLDGVEIEIKWIDKSVKDGKDFDECLIGYMEEHSASRLYVVRIANQGELPPPDVITFDLDYEVILVHELHHILNFRWECNSKLRPFLVPDSDTNEVLGELYEQSLDTVAEALVRARRGITR